VRRSWFALAGGAAAILILTTGVTGAGAANVAVDCGAGASLQAAIDAHQGTKAVLVVSGVCSGTFTVTRALTLRAAPGGANIDGGGRGSALTVLSGQVSVSGMTIARGAGFRGGGIENRGRLTLTGVAVTGNRTDGFGGGIGNTGTLVLTGSTVDANQAPGALGGGIFNAGTLTITNSTIGGAAGNSAGYGGGIVNFGTLQITSSHVDGNTSTGPAGGLYDGGKLSLTDSSVSGNVAAGNGGGIVLASAAATAVTGSTISGNTSSGSSGGGLYLGASPATLDRTTVSGNGAYGDGGGIADVGGGTGLTVSDSNLTGNTSELGNGGGIVNESFDGISTIAVTGTTISGNSASGPDVHGGGIANFSVGTHAATVTLASSTLTSNSAPNGYGGDLANGALTSGTSASATATLIGTEVSYGQAIWGGGIYNSGRYATAVLEVGAGSAVSHNLAFTDGGGIYDFAGGTVVLSESAVLSTNEPDDESDVATAPRAPAPPRGSGRGGFRGGP